MPPRSNWGVVVFTRRGPFEVFGPYWTRADAVRVRDGLIIEDLLDDATGHRHRVVRMDYLMSDRLMQRVIQDSRRT